MTQRRLTPTIHRFETLDSTNLKAKELARRGASEGTVVVAKTQSAGRGSNKRIWHSPDGGLYASFILSPRTDRKATDLTIVAGAAISQAVKQLLPKAKDVSVKWPNDCLVDWKKVGGILCENLGDDYGQLCIVGVGLNINIGQTELAPFATNPFSATSFMVETQGGKFDIDEVLDMVTKKLFTLYTMYHEDGFEPVRGIWQSNCGFIGKRVELKESGWQTDSQSKGVVGVFEGIDDQGGFVLSNPRGERRQYVTGEITCFWP